jgi:hypothetical protein
MATADASGPFQWPLIDGMVALSGAGGVAVEPMGAVNHGPFYFLADFQNADPDPASYPGSPVERGAERHTQILENRRNQHYSL